MSLQLQSPNKNKYFLLLILIILTLLPFIFRDNLYYLGGDDMRLYYLFPEKYLQNFVFNIASGNTLAGAATGYATVAYYAPLIIIFKILSYTQLNVQSLALGLNFASAYLFFYLLISFWIKGEDFKSIFAKHISAFFYVFSPVFLETLYKTQLLSIYLVSVMPAAIYFFIKSFRTKKVVNIIVSALIISIFSGTVANLPWILGSAILMVLIVLPDFFKKIKRSLIYSLVFLISLLLLNFYWIFHFINSSLGSEIYSSHEFVSENLRVAAGVSSMFSPLSQVFLSLSSFKIYNGVFLLLIILSLFIKSKRITIYPFLILGFTVSFYLFNPNIGEWGPKLFVSLTQNIPFWGMFRNMFDKFALPLAFYYSMCLGMALHLIFKKLSTLSAVFVSLILIFIVLLNNVSFFKSGLTVEDEQNLVSGKFNTEYLQLIEYLEQNNPQNARVLWMPLNGPTYANISDQETPNKYYSGLSPLRVLTGIDDLTGRFSFINQFDWFVGDKIFEKVKEGEITSAAEDIAKMNIYYIVTINENLPKKINSFMYGEDSNQFLDNMKLLENQLLGQKVQEFGNSYQLYIIKPEYKKESLVVKIDNSNYIYNQKSSKLPEKIILYEPYNEGWKLSNSNKANHKIYEGWANSWEIEGDEILIYFEPSKYNKVIFGLSIISYILAFIFVSLNNIKKITKNDKNEQLLSR